MIVILLVLFAAAVLTAGVRAYALRTQLLDIPNARSSHSVPTPRGGGVAIVISFLAGSLWLWLENLLPLNLLASVLVAGGAVAIVGFLDDHGHVAARWRLLVHFGAAGTAIFFLGRMPELIVFGAAVDLGLVGQALAVFLVVWLLNLYNFMDGIDGIAALEAATASLGMALLYVLNGANASWLWPALLGAASLGFLIWNFPPAKIFMGDAGSGFVGYALGVLTVSALWIAPGMFWAWLIMLAVFVADATTTLVRRLLRGEKVYEAHRSHAYQWASRRVGKHLPVTLAVAALNVGWLFPIAYAAASGMLDGALATLIAYAPLVVLAVTLGAGTPEKATPLPRSQL